MFFWRLVLHPKRWKIRIPLTMRTPAIRAPNADLEIRGNLRRQVARRDSNASNFFKRDAAWLGRMRRRMKAFVSTESLVRGGGVAIFSLWARRQRKSAIICVMIDIFLVADSLAYPVL